MNPGLSVTFIIISVFLSAILAGGTWKGSAMPAGREQVVVAKASTPSKEEGFKVYPNPATDHIMLRTGISDTEKLGYQLYDMTGMMIQEDNIEGAETHISMEHLAPSLYFLKVKRGSVTLVMFKIIKN